MNRYEIMNRKVALHKKKKKLETSSSLRKKRVINYYYKKRQDFKSIGKEIVETSSTRGNTTPLPYLNPNLIDIILGYLPKTVRVKRSFQNPLKCHICGDYDCQNCRWLEDVLKDYDRYYRYNGNNVTGFIDYTNTYLTARNYFHFKPDIDKTILFIECESIKIQKRNRDNFFNVLIDELFLYRVYQDLISRKLPRNQKVRIIFKVRDDIRTRFLDMRFNQHNPLVFRKDQIYSYGITKEMINDEMKTIKIMN